MKTRRARVIFDIITCVLLTAAVALCILSTMTAWPEAVPVVVSFVAGLGFIGILSGLVFTRVWFRASYFGWITWPVKIGFWKRVGEPMWRLQDCEVMVEAIVRFWERRHRRDDIIKALEDLTVFVRPKPWTYLKRMVVGVASNETAWVKWQEDIGKSAFAHELSHVIIGNIDGQWDEKKSHQLMDIVGFSRDAVASIVDEIQEENRKWAVDHSHMT